MCKQLCLFLLLVLLEYSSQVNGECVLNKFYIERSFGTFAKHDHEHLIPQRLNSIADGDALEVFCWQKGDKIDTLSIKCNGGKLEPKNPLRCRGPIEARVLETSQDDFCLAQMYHIGIQTKDTFLEFYRVCYDKENVKSYFSDARIYWKNIHPKRPKTFFTSDGLITPAQAASFQSKNIYQAFVKLFGDQQTYIKKIDEHTVELVINRGHLTAAGDMLFPDQVTSTFKYSNVVPQFESINSGNWLQIEHWVGNSIPKNSFVHVRTGALDVLSLLDFKATRTLKPAFLIPETNKNPVPEWMYKIVRNANDQLLHVFLTYNNIFNPKKPAAHKCCTTTKCPFKLDDSATLGFTYCCEPEAFVKCLPKRT